MSARTGAGGIPATIIPDQASPKALSSGAKAGKVPVSLQRGISERDLARNHQAPSTSTLPNDTLCKTDSNAQASSKARSHNNNSNSNNHRPSAPNGQRSQPSDYFGPVTTSGPFTDGYKDNGEAGTSPGRERGVIATPQSRGDIVGAVEMDSSPSQLFIDTGHVMNGNANMDANTVGIRPQNGRQQTMEYWVELP
ncbi:hypothetical protein HYFRA_00003238 [Hymenoscyphus fraxineus]|uniref:Uncharacterized protein n=1 Tax=Hymenoscyphus fraxineus TaxID=746836 RepID=A0A9N9PHG5_9HELO|nr:hypothetical protein HYFRA_00003238 [Hymenoscyphus fraxineus]